MARKGRKTRWRKLPIPIGTSQGGAASAHTEDDIEPDDPSLPCPKENVSRVTFNEDEYTKITTPRQDMLFKKGYLGRKKASSEQASAAQPQPPHSPSESVESSEQYIGCEEAIVPPPYTYPTGFVDQNGIFYVNGGSYEVYDPYTGNVTVIVGPGAGYPAQPVLAAMPCHPVPLQPLEWFNPQHAWQPQPLKKRHSTDSQNWGSSCESPASPQEPVEAQEQPVFYPQYVYPGYMFGAPLYTVNGMTVQGAAAASVQPPPPVSTADPPKRRKKRRKKRRPGMGEEGSESSCEEQGGSGGSGGSSDAGQGSSCSKTTDSGVHTANSGADSPQPAPQPHDSVSDSADSQPSRGPGNSVPVRETPTNSFDDASTEEVCNGFDEVHSQDEVSKQEDSDDGISEVSTFVENSLPEERWHPASELNEKLEDDDRLVVPETCVSINEIESVQPPSTECKTNDPKKIEDSENPTEELLKSTTESSCLQENNERVIDTFDREKSDQPTNSRQPEDPVYNRIQESLQMIDTESVEINRLQESLKYDRLQTHESTESNKDEKEDKESGRIKVYTGKNKLLEPEQSSGDTESAEHWSNAEDNVEESQVKDQIFIQPECLNPLSDDLRRLDSEKVDSKEPSPALEAEEQWNNAEDSSPTQSAKEGLLSSKESSTHEGEVRWRNDETNPLAEPEETWGSAEETTTSVDLEENFTETELAIDALGEIKPITEAVTRWLESQGTLISQPPEDSEDEGIEDDSTVTGQKNADGNPFLVPYHSVGAGTRVAYCDNFSLDDWKLWAEKCDPVASVDRYYRLAADSPTQLKTAALHINPSAPFPCGLVCCILQ